MNDNIDLIYNKLIDDEFLKDNKELFKIENHKTYIWIEVFNKEIENKIKNIIKETFKDQYNITKDTTYLKEYKTGENLIIDENNGGIYIYIDNIININDEILIVNRNMFFNIIVGNIFNYYNIYEYEKIIRILKNKYNKLIENNIIIRYIMNELEKINKLNEIEGINDKIEKTEKNLIDLVVNIIKETKNK